MREKAVKEAHTRPEFPYVYDIRPIILKFDSIEIYILASIFEQGDFIIELFGDENQFLDLAVVRKLLDSFSPITVGYCKTVIDGHYNIMLLVGNKFKDEDSYPIEFIKF